MVRGSYAPPLQSRTQWKRKCFYVFLAVAFIYLLVTGLVAHLTRNTPASKRLENEEWINSSRFWLDRLLCRFVGCCGTFHMLNRAGWVWSDDLSREPTRDFSDFWHSGTEQASSWSIEERSKREIPQYVFDYAPYVHLFSGETYWPSDIAEHLVHTAPYVNHTLLSDLDGRHTLANLAELNDIKSANDGDYIYLHSDDNIERLPGWLRSDHNIPAEQEPLLQASTNGRCSGNSGMTCIGSSFGQCCSIFGYCGSGSTHCGSDCNPTAGRCYGPAKPGRNGPHRDLRRRQVDHDVPSGSPGRSGAPVILLVVPKANGIVDAFWFFFYSYNQGKKVLNIRFGNHVGDWEHTMIRFKHGVPYQAFLSAHSWGEAVDFAALEKYMPSQDRPSVMLSSWTNASLASTAKRPVVYSADGSHAMYATADYHAYVAPFGILHDDTDRGPLWDPLLNVKSFTYDVEHDHVRSSTHNADAPTSWFDYRGHWGDRYYLLSDPRQYRFAGEYHYVNGPLGPKFKNLGRTSACIRLGECEVRDQIDERGGGTEPLHMALLTDDPEDDSVLE